MKQLLLLIFLLVASTIYSQSLSKGDIAFVGYNTDSGPGTSTDHSFSFITLTDIPANEIIFFTEEGWNDDTNNWAGTAEGHIKWTASGGGVNCGTVIYITESGANTFTVIGDGTATLESGSGWNLSGGDQVLAYQATSAEPATTPTFISGINGDDGNGSPVSFDPVTMWNNPSTGPLGTAKSGLPNGLTNGVDCVSLFVAVFTEEDNAKYTGTLTGTSTVLRGLINDRTNWSFNNSTAFDITPSAYTTSIDCTTLSIDNPNLKTKIKVYPNPSSDLIKVVGLKTTETYTIYNILGKAILEGNIINNGEIRINSLSKGFYLLKIENKKPVKFLKE